MSFKVQALNDPGRHEFRAVVCGITHENYNKVSLRRIPTKQALSQK